MLMPLVLFVISLVFSALIPMPQALEALSRRSAKFARMNGTHLHVMVRWYTPACNGQMIPTYMEQLDGIGLFVLVTGLHLLFR